MRFSLIDIDLAEVETAPVSDDVDGHAVLIRVNGVPAAFDMSRLSPEENGRDLVRRLVGRQSQAILRALLLAKLKPSQPLLPVSLTVAICTKDRPALVERCLRSIAACRPPWADVIVIDNAPSSSETRDVVAAHTNVRYALEPRPGLDIARNRAIAETSSAWLAFVDDDAVIDKGYFDGIAAAVADNPDAGGLTGLVLPFELESEAQILFEQNGGFGRGFLPRRYAGELTGAWTYPCGAGIFGAGCNMAFRIDVLEQIGRFDEALDTGGLLPGGGDLDIFYRVVRSGAVLVYDPRMLVFHQHRVDMKGLTRQYWSWGLGMMAFVVKNRRHDPEMRGRFTALLQWWFVNQTRRLALAMLGRGTMPASMLWAELKGAIQGLAGEYDRSRRRVGAVQKGKK